MVMELVEGADLSGPFPVDVVMDYARQIAIGLEAAHVNVRAFDGLIDELAVYGRALTASEIQAIFSAGSVGK